MRQAATALVLILAAGAARADAIDGEWCSPDGTGHLRIAGNLIETPGGTTTTGDYSRHAFAYVIPEGDAGAGGEVTMRLLDEEDMQIWLEPAASEIWHRCKPVA